MADRARHGNLTRRQLMQGAAGATVLALTGGAVDSIVSRADPSLPPLESFGSTQGDRVRAFRSRPDLRPPTVRTSRSEGLVDADPGLLFLGPGPVSLKGSQQFGPLIVDRAGAPVWFRPLAPGLQVTNFARSRYRGKPVLVWWEGKILPSGYGQGEAVVLDRSYREVARVRAAGGRSMDLHALTVTPEGTALFTCYPETVAMDLSSVGGPRSSRVLESIIQEVEIASGRLVSEWRSLQHIPVGASKEPMSEPYDYLHVNSVQRLPDGNLLVSARHTWALYKLDRRSGKVIWTLGGKRSQFEVDSAARFAWQHDARQPSNGVLTLFDNGTNGPIKTERQSRGIALEVDERRRRAKLRAAYTSRHKLVAGAMGSVQTLPSGRVIVGWGVASYTSEFAADGTVLSEFALPGGMYSYRGLLLPWRSIPHHRPELSSRRDRQHGTAVLYASWNGATDVTGWLLAAGASPARLQARGIAQRRGFETEIPVPTQYRYASVTALDRVGRPLKRSQVIKL